MRFTRRAFLAGSSAALAVPRAGWSAIPSRIAAAPEVLRIAPDAYPKTEVWAYGGQVPGQLFRARQGDMLDVIFENNLPEDSSLHWHGLRLPNAMDGVPGLTQDEVAPGDSFHYKFPLHDAGTYWYHSHSNSIEQVGRGLGGALIVDEADIPDVDADHLLVLDDWRLNEDASIHDSFAAPHDHSHGGRLGNYVTVNGKAAETLSGRSGDRLRLRFLNMATDRNFQLVTQGVDFWLMALDGMPLATPQKVENIILAPAQRADVFADITSVGGEQALIGMLERDGAFVLAENNVLAGGPATARGAPAPLPPNPRDAVDLSAAKVVDFTMTGGAMRGLGPTRFEGKLHTGAELAGLGQFWAFNGVAGMPERPLVTAQVGETIRLSMVNDTAFPHAMHLHGHHFREVSANGALGPWRDTILLDVSERRDIAFVASEPGNWAFHCHMLAHAASGMLSWLRIVA